MMEQTLGLCAALATLAACATPTPPSISAYDVDRAFVEARRIDALPLTASADVPSGTVTYDGQIGADVRGDATGSILADMTMIVGFDSNTISGTVTGLCCTNRLMAEVPLSLDRLIPRSL